MHLVHVRARDRFPSASVVPPAATRPSIPPSSSVGQAFLPVWRRRRLLPPGELSAVSNQRSAISVHPLCSLRLCGNSFPHRRVFTLEVLRHRHPHARVPQVPCRKFPPALRAPPHPPPPHFAASLVILSPHGRRICFFSLCFLLAVFICVHQWLRISEKSARFHNRVHMNLHRIAHPMRVAARKRNRNRNSP